MPSPLKGEGEDKKMLNWQEREKLVLAPWGMPARLSRGRIVPEEEHPFRSPYQRDRDRIIHTTAFRRLEYKTQVFVIHEGDYYRTRLTHTLEVAQIARTIARALGLNEDLTEAISLAHDLGHTPFGHSGEAALHDLMKNYGGYEHNRQSLRVVDKLEHRYPGFEGLNLTFEVREGIKKHTTQYDTPETADFEPGPPTLEAQVVNIADEIAYNSHDVDDGLKSGLITRADLKPLKIWKSVSGKLTIKNDEELYRYQAVRNLINLVTTNLVENTRAKLQEAGITSPEEARKIPTLVTLSPRMERQHRELKDFLLDRMYKHYRIVRMSEKAKRIVREIFTVYLGPVEQLPPAVQQKIREGEKQAQAVCDYIAGMTDSFAQEEHQRLFDPTVRV